MAIVGRGDIPMAAKVIQEGACGFIEKPLDESILVHAVEAAIKQSAKVEELTGKLLTNSETRILQLIFEGKSNSAELTKVALALGLICPQIK